MSKQSVLFLGSKPIGYHCLNYLIQHQDAFNIEIIGLLSNDNTTFDSTLSLKKLAKEYNILLIDALNEMPESDFIISVQYHEILKKQDIDKAKILAINLHMAPLPEYRGCNQFSFAILDGKKEFGTTIHKMDARIDHGDIIAEKRFPIPTNCWVNELYDLTYSASLSLFQENIANILSNQFTLQTQKDFENERGTSIHFRNEIHDIKRIDLSWDKEKIERHIRATYMPAFEPPYAMIGNEKIYFSTTWNEKK